MKSSASLWFSSITASSFVLPCAVFFSRNSRSVSNKRIGVPLYLRRLPRQVHAQPLHLLAVFKLRHAGDVLAKRRLPRIQPFLFFFGEESHLGQGVVYQRKVLHLVQLLYEYPIVLSLLKELLFASYLYACELLECPQVHSDGCFEVGLNMGQI